jgi:hypothetical protein
MVARCKPEPITTLVLRQNTAWARCNKKWESAPGVLADEADVNAMNSAAHELEGAVPRTMEEFLDKWRNLAGYWREFEFNVTADDIFKMLIDLSRVTRQ